jgi:spermidine synthase
VGAGQLTHGLALVSNHCPVRPQWATLPALEGLREPLFGAGRHVGCVYAANTFGAVTGTTLTTFLLAPALGYAHTLWACVLVSLACAGGVLWLRHRVPRAPGVTETQVAGGPQREARLLTTVFVTGFLGLSYEVLVIRALSQVLEDTAFTFAVVLSIYLLGTASGAAIYQRRLASRTSDGTLSLLLLVASFATLSGVAVLWLSDTYYE